MAKFGIKKFGKPDKSGGIKDVFSLSPNTKLQWNKILLSGIFDNTFDNTFN